ncbi:TRAP transporter small permease subunit [Desulfallas sp. Bu1-1]|jgi:TRAP-type C4-dicarboxylate transport system permease small subunit|uniref:TRAP transporter small permease n=1 Tax=Desulfallas sp. Bu1-1 TaxID=2787620 RepID=UPI00189E0882|nr:TRAP transporter small permease subunit [Desulfallas sp. Bu1-1]MBF7082556.1 TRAP transporter small permease subunit [Desulfallas sp. Bu1-1]
MGINQKSNTSRGQAEQAVAKLTALGDVLEKMQLAIGSFLLAFFLTVVLVDVVMRESGHPVVWLQDVARFAFMWTVFFGAAIGFRHGTHYRIELFAGNKFLTPFVFLCQAIFILVLIIYGYQFAMMGLERVAMPSGIPIFYSAVSIPLAGLFMLYYLVESIRVWINVQRGG